MKNISFKNIKDIQGIPSSSVDFDTENEPDLEKDSDGLTSVEYLTDSEMDYFDSDNASSGNLSNLAKKDGDDKKSSISQSDKGKRPGDSTCSSFYSTKGKGTGNPSFSSSYSKNPSHEKSKLPTLKTKKTENHLIKTRTQPTGVLRNQKNYITLEELGTQENTSFSFKEKFAVEKKKEPFGKTLLEMKEI